MNLIHRTAINVFACFSCLFVVSSAVRFTSLPPTSVEAPEKGEASFPCKIDEFPGTYTFKWFRVVGDNVPTEIVSNNRFVITENSGLKIKAVEPNDGIYKYNCSVYDGESHVLSGISSLVVLLIPQEEYPKCNDLQEIKMGDEVVLSCESERTNAELHLNMRWNNSFDLNLDNENQNDKIIVTHSFIASKNDNGAVITCKLMSKVLGTETRQCSFGPLNVKYQPIIYIEGDLQLESGTEKVFVCSADANPDVTKYNWNTDLSKDKYNIENAGQAIRVKPIHKYGVRITLTCSARNDVDESRKSMTVTIVKGHPKFISTGAPYYSSRPLNKNKNPQSATSYTTILSVTGAFLLLLASMMTLLLCIFLLYSRRHQSLDYTGQRVPQPDVYFEPKDSVATMRKSVEGKWKRSIGAQVPMDLDKDSISLYAEIEEGKKT